MNTCVVRGLLAAMLVWMPGGIAQAVEDVQVVVAIRQYQEEGPSNIHLYLYGLDGKLRKQLTVSPGLDEQSPVFSSDGKSVAFERTASDPRLKNKAGRFVVDIASGKERPLDQALTSDVVNSDYDFHSETVEAISGDASFFPDELEGKDAASLSSPDGRFKLIQAPSKKPNDYGDFGVDYFLRDAKKRAVAPIASFSGFMPSGEMNLHEHILAANGSPFVFGGDLVVVFLTHHLNSTDGNSVWGFDLKARCWTCLSRTGGGQVYHLPGAGDFFFVRESRYEALKKTGLSVNCSYLEHGDSRLQMVPLAMPCSAFYGATVHRTDENTPSFSFGYPMGS